MALHRTEITTGSGNFFSARYFLILDISGKVCLSFTQQQSCWMLPWHLPGASWTHKSENYWFSKVLQEKTFVLSQLFELSWFPFLCFFPLCWSVWSSPLLLQSSFSLTWPNGDPNYCSSVFPPFLEVFFLSFANHNPSRPLCPIRSLKYYPLSRDRKGCSSLPPPFSSLLPLFSCCCPRFLLTLTSVVPQHLNGSTHPQLAGSSAPPACGWLDNIDLYTAREFTDLLISRQFKVCLASYHTKIGLWAILHSTTVDGIFKVNIRTQYSIFGS